MTKTYESLADAFKACFKEFKINPPDFVLEKLVGLWNKHAILARFFPDSESVLKDLKKDYKLILLTNTNKFAFMQVNEKFKLSEKFDKIYASYATGMLKINPKVFEKILKDFKLKKEDVIMVGDSIESDIKGAENAGIKSVLLDRWERKEFDPKIKELAELKDHIVNLKK
jgi:putative hydrolase of the HAD superfamily